MLVHIGEPGQKLWGGEGVIFKEHLGEGRGRKWKIKSSKIFDNQKGIHSQLLILAQNNPYFANFFFFKLTLKLVYIILYSRGHIHKTFLRKFLKSL